jgi:thiol-disulfide isomerase/thioredoxin
MLFMHLIGRRATRNPRPFPAQSGPFSALARVLVVCVLAFSGFAAAQDRPLPTLKIGDAAPALSAGKWLKGEPVQTLEVGTPYVVEFWASWCETCMHSTPQLGRVQRQYAGDGLVCIGVNIWDDPDKAKQYVQDHQDQFDFRVALDKPPPDGNPKIGVSGRAWVSAAGRDQPPVAFLVDRGGRVVWIGHPLSPRGVFEEMVGLLVRDELTSERSRDLAQKYAELEARAREISERFSAAMAAKDYDNAAAAMDDLIDLSPKLYGLGGVMNRFHVTLVLQHDYRGAYAWARTIGDRFWDDAFVLNAVAWAIVDTPGLEVRDLDLAMKFTKRSNDLTGNANAAFLDTLARAHYETGNLDKALEIETRAVSLAEPEFKKELGQALERYQKAIKDREH